MGPILKTTNSTNRKIMNINLTLDELIDFVLTSKDLTYNIEDIISLEEVMNEKVESILDESEKEFYLGVVEGLIFEMIESIKNSKPEEANPLKKRYDKIGRRLTFDVSNNACKENLMVKTYKLNSKLDYMSKIDFSFFDTDSSMFTKSIISFMRPIEDIIPGYKLTCPNNGSEEDLFLRSGPLHKVN